LMNGGEEEKRVGRANPNGKVTDKERLREKRLVANWRNILHREVTKKMTAEENEK